MSQDEHGHGDDRDTTNWVPGSSPGRFDPASAPSMPPTPAQPPAVPPTDDGETQVFAPPGPPPSRPAPGPAWPPPSSRPASSFPPASSDPSPVTPSAPPLPSHVAAPPPAPGPSSRLGLLAVVAAAVVVAVAVMVGGTVWLLVRGGDGDTATSGGTTSTLGDDRSLDSSSPAATVTGVDAAPPGPEELARSVVQIQLLLDGSPVCVGSGTIVDPAGYVVTNYHVVEQSPVCPHDQIGVAVADASDAVPQLRYSADLLTFDPDLDLAVVRLAENLDGTAVTSEFEAVEIGDSNGVKLGDELRVIGFPSIGGETVTFTTGSVSGFTRAPEGGQRSWLKTDATITGGNSGGLAADADGRFVGIPTRAGSGDGQIVDCRVVADSNGDGRFDENDSCVPIGGFINGIRPVALALPLIDEAYSAQPIDPGDPQREEPVVMDDLAFAFNPTWTIGVDADGFPIDEMAAAPAGIAEICLTWDYSDLPNGTIIEGFWYLDGQSIRGASDGPEVNEGPGDGSAFACLSSDEGGLDSGTFEYLWFQDEELIFAEGIVVDQGVTATIEVFNDSSVPVCVVQFNPTGTVSWGLNELDAELAPGDSRVFTVGIGRLDARIIDCDGDIRIEDASGYQVSENLELSVD